MTVYWVYYFKRAWVRVAAEDPKQARWVSRYVFPLYYPNLEIDRRWLVPIPEDEPQFEFALKEFGK